MNQIEVDGEIETLPKDWPIVALSTGLHDYWRLYVRRDGRLIPLSEALSLRELVTTSSKPHVRASTPRQE